MINRKYGEKPQSVLKPLLVDIRRNQQLQSCDDSKILLEVVASEPVDLIESLP